MMGKAQPCAPPSYRYHIAYLRDSFKVVDRAPKLLRDAFPVGVGLHVNRIPKHPVTCSIHMHGKLQHLFPLGGCHLARAAYARALHG